MCSLAIVIANPLFACFPINCDLCCNNNRDMPYDWLCSRSCCWRQKPYPKSIVEEDLDLHWDIQVLGNHISHKAMNSIDLARILAYRPRIKSCRKEYYLI